MTNDKIREEFNEKFPRLMISINESPWDKTERVEGDGKIAFDWFMSKLTDQRREIVEMMESKKKKIYDNWATTNDRDEERFTKLSKEEKIYNQALADTLSDPLLAEEK